MSTKSFTDQEIEILKQNKYVKRVGPKGITFTDEMKHFAIAKSNNSITSTEIFEQAGFNISLIGNKRAINALNRWKRTYKIYGVTGLRDSRKGSSGRPLSRKLSLEEKVVRLEAKNKYLEFQLEVQKKLDMIERGVYTPNNKKKQK